jgi:hypothetical protein
LFGGYGTVRADMDLLVFTRELESERILVALNFGEEPTTACFDSGSWVGRLLISSGGDREGEVVRGCVKLRAHEGAVVELSERGPMRKVG